jgi:hypothetical protein
MVIMLTEAWELECENIQHKIKISKYANSRRKGLAPLDKPFSKSHNCLSAGERKVLQVIYERHADKEVSSYELGRLPGNLSCSDSESVVSVDTSVSDMDLLVKKVKVGAKMMSSTGIDWDAVKADAAVRNIVPYLQDRSAFIISKSNGELEYITKVTMLQQRKREEWRKLLSDSGWQDEWMWGGIKVQELLASPKQHKSTCVANIVNSCRLSNLFCR